MSGAPTPNDGPGMLDVPDMIGHASAYVEANVAGIGSGVVFKQSEWVVTLRIASRRSTQIAGVGALFDLEQEATPARTVDPHCAVRGS